MTFNSDLLHVLDERGFVNQATDLVGLDALAAKSISAYVGFDLTAASLHVGSLIPLMACRWMTSTGHRPIILLGEATTRIGDPSGKTTTRPILTHEVIAANEVGIRKTIQRIISDAKFETNMSWFRDVNYIDLLQKYGHHFTVNRMMTFDSVKSRLARKEPLTFLEFNYLILQSIDFLELFLRENVMLQVGGSDQWGNIVSGVDLVRRLEAKDVFGLTMPLLTDSKGEKIGKSTGGATVWLDPDKTSPFDFWQFWRNVEDAKVEEFLGLFTELPMDEVRRLGSLQGQEINSAKKILATEVSAMVHGREVALLCEVGSFDTHQINLDLDPTVVDALIRTKMVGSKGEADRLAAQSGIRLDGIVLTSARQALTPGTFVLSIGKKKLVRIVCQLPNGAPDDFR